MEIHSEIGTLFHILVHHGPNTGQIVMKFAVYIIYNIWYIVSHSGQTNGGEPEAVISTTSCTFGALEANAVMSNHRI